MDSTLREIPSSDAAQAFADPSASPLTATATPMTASRRVGPLASASRLFLSPIISHSPFREQIVHHVPPRRATKRTCNSRHECQKGLVDLRPLWLLRKKKI